MLAIALAQRTHAPTARYINCVGAIDPVIDRVWPASVEPDLLHACAETIDLPGIFDLARDGGVDAMFFGAAQVDRHGNINLDRIGPAHRPKVRFPGPAGSPSMRSWVRRVLIGVPRQSPRNLVATVDVATSVPGERNQETILVTDLAIWHLVGGRFTPHQTAAGIDYERLSSATGFALPDGVPGHAPPPSDLERAALQHIDPADERHRLFGAGRPSSPSKLQQPENVLHER